MKEEQNYSASFQEEIFFSLRSQRNKWATMAILSLVITLVCVVLIVVMLPLKEVRPYVIMVDKTTGAAEKVVQVAPVQLSEQEAVIQSELVRYVIDRETYDVSDNKTRIPDLVKRSSGQALASLKALWNSSNPDYPPDVYKDDSQVVVNVLSATNLDNKRAQVRFRKVLIREGFETVERDFVATISFEFRPRVERNLELVWQNPLGFTVTGYRVDAETLNKNRS